MHSERTLLVIVHDQLSDLVTKGEVTPRYYNPGDVFDHVCILLLNEDQPDAAAIQPMVGSARLTIRNLPVRRAHWLRAPLWGIGALNAWAQEAVQIARDVQPTLIRSYGGSLNAFAAFQIHQALGTPYVVSIHRQPDDDARQRAISTRHRLLDVVSESAVRAALRHAHTVLPVYRSILPYLARRGVQSARVVYNSVAAVFDSPRTDYRAHNPLRIVSVGRQIPSKDPSCVIEAVATMPDAQLTLVGDGPLHAQLQALATNLGIADRVQFIRALQNEQLAALHHESDLFVIRSEHDGVPKTVIEASLCGMPTVLAGRGGAATEETAQGWAELVTDPADLSRTLQSLATDESARRSLGVAARRFAETTWRPQDTEAQVADLYRAIVNQLMPVPQAVAI